MKIKKRVWWVFSGGVQWDGPHYTEASADDACIRARFAGHPLVYVEQVTVLWGRIGGVK